MLFRKFGGKRGFQKRINVQLQQHFQSFQPHLLVFLRRWNFTGGCTWRECLLLHSKKKKTEQLPLTVNFFFAVLFLCSWTNFLHRRIIHQSQMRHRAKDHAMWLRAIRATSELDLSPWAEKIFLSDKVMNIIKDQLFASRCRYRFRGGFLVFTPLTAAKSGYVSFFVLLIVPQKKTYQWMDPSNKYDTLLPKSDITCSNLKTIKNT